MEEILCLFFFLPAVSCTTTVGRKHVETWEFALKHTVLIKTLSFSVWYIVFIERLSRFTAPNTGSIVCWVAELNTALCVITRAKKWKIRRTLLPLAHDWPLTRLRNKHNITFAQMVYRFNFYLSIWLPTDIYLPTSLAKLISWSCIGLNSWTRLPKTDGCWSSIRVSGLRLDAKAKGPVAPWRRSTSSRGHEQTELIFNH